MNFKIKHFKRIPSTSDYLLQEAKKGMPEGAVVTTDYQTKGRGRYQRKWVSPPGKNLLFSLLLRPDLKPSQAPFLTHVACTSVRQVLETQYGIQATIKKPNDLLVAGKKICGILVESSSSSNNKLDFAVIGIGLNVNSAENELIPTATSFKIIKGREYSIKRLFKALLSQIKTDLTAYVG